VGIFLHTVCESFKSSLTSKHSHTLTDVDKVVALAVTPNVSNRDHEDLEENLDVP